MKLESWTWTCTQSSVVTAWCGRDLVAHLRRRRTWRITRAGALCSWMRKERIHRDNTLGSHHFPALFCKWSRRGSRKSLWPGRKTGCRPQMSSSPLRCVWMQSGRIRRVSLTVCQRKNALLQALRRTLLSLVYFFVSALMPTWQITTAYAASLIRRKSQSGTSRGSVHVFGTEDSSWTWPTWALTKEMAFQCSLI